MRWGSNLFAVTINFAELGLVQVREWQTMFILLQLGGAGGYNTFVDVYFTTPCGVY